MKKIVAILLALMMVLSLAACGAKEEPAQEAASDLEYVKEKGVLVVGITNYEPMDYKDENGEWIGFDADMARAFAEHLGVEIEFVEIDWGSKILEVDAKNIDCVWNGMTLTDEVMAGMDCSSPYFNNAQSVVVPADKVDAYKAVEDLADLSFSVEAGSAGEKEAQAHDFAYAGVETQALALTEVASMTSDAAIVDYLMAMAMVGEGTDYSDLAYLMDLTVEHYGVGFRKGSDLVGALNEFFSAAYADGSMIECAETYGLAAALIEQ